MTVKLHGRLLGAHVHADVFVGVDEGHLQLTGTLVMDVGEWQTFASALLLGSEKMKAISIVLTGASQATRRME